ncbi:MAG: preprotein translocase subunit YajC [Pseudomonadota bacterium]|nr:preprotein translocase subunit YajC [Pseudomonadota bacterium]
MFISEAWAQSAGGGGGDIMTTMFPLLLIFAVFYFLIIRPSQKKQKEHREMLAAIRRGDKVVTGGGIFGTVTKVVSDDEVQVEISDGVRVKIARATLASVVSKTEPVGEKAKDKDKKSNKEGEEQKPKAANDTEASDKDEKKEGVSLLSRLTGKD